LVEALAQSAKLREMLAVMGQEQSIREQIWQVRLDGTKEEWRIRLEAAEMKFQIERDEYEKRRVADQKEIESLRNPPFWRSNEFNRLVGMILGIAVGISAGGI
jgi:hypothetical protein